MTWLTTITCLSGSYSYGHQKVCFLHLLLLVFMETWLCEKEIDIFCHVKCCDFVYKNYFEGTWFHQKKKKRCEELIHVKKLRQQNFIMLFWSKVFNSAVSVNCDYKIDLF